jgi:hypothetical protein
LPPQEQLLSETVKVSNDKSASVYKSSPPELAPFIVRLDYFRLGGDSTAMPAEPCTQVEQRLESLRFLQWVGSE